MVVTTEHVKWRQWNDIKGVSKCYYLDSEEDHYRTTSYPICRCGMKHCREYVGHCPIRDDR